MVIKDLQADNYSRVNADIHMMKLEVEKTVKKMMERYSWKIHKNDKDKVLELIKRQVATEICKIEERKLVKRHQYDKEKRKQMQLEKEQDEMD